jgi:hypothetical protein
VLRHTVHHRGLRDSDDLENRRRDVDHVMELESQTAAVANARDDFMLIVSPLPVMGGTGSPANPLAMF